MVIDNSIFGIPFKPDRSLQPKPEQMNAFLQSAGKDGGKGLHGDDLIHYRRLLESADAFEQAQLQDAKSEDIPKHMVNAILRYSRFADHNVLSAIELFKYHLHTLKLKSTDFNALVSFIRAAERIMRRLNKNKLLDVLRMVRLQEMINERKKIIEQLKLPSPAIITELYRIARYIQNTLAAIEKRCESSIVLLSDPDVIGKKENQIIEDIKERPKKALLAGTIAREDLESATREVNLIADKMLSVIREDSKTLTGLYEAIHGHQLKTAQVIEARLAELKTKKSRRVEEYQQLFSTVEQSLVSFLSTPPLEQLAPNIHLEAAYKKFITKKRKEMLGYFFEVLFAALQKDRRSQSDRRSSQGRRIFSVADDEGPKRRSGKDRRTGKKRRQSANGSS